ncbi:ribosome biogenesis GTPase Der [Salaquimonas pukyongi]|uniref:ribosome biogenesis GTPase Der n=1 Tax=Salaquimonas pukyongi TaxID=2712698 RepID=UPI00096BA4F3|nr:ribosome biogenesis GTPase Der [Salaquimonas pukyongi]
MGFTAAIIGRPNVGKSTLFNRLVGKRLALVDDTPGVTRDRRLADARIGDLHFQVIDTAGLEEADTDSLEGRMRQQTELAIGEADVSLFLVDAKTGITPTDKAFAQLLRKHGKPVVLVANKMEGKAAEQGFYDAYSLGFGQAVPISAEHGTGMADLYGALVEAVGEERAFDAGEDLPVDGDEAGEDEYHPVFDEAGNEILPAYDTTKPLRIAVVGRPNAGKSTLINQMIGEERLLTGPEAGITRDSISVDWQWEGRTIRLFDTAGMRKKARVQEKLEKLSVSDGLRSVQYAEVVIVVIDAETPFEKQDVQIADLVIREGRAPVIAVNKWDTIEDRQARLAEIREMAEASLSQVKRLKVVPVSALTGEGLAKLMEAVAEVHEQWNRRIPTARLNRWLEEIQYHHPPPAVAGRRIRLKFITQAKTRPPTFMVHCTRPEAMPTSYSRYMVNNIRETFDLWSVPVRLAMRKADNPYAMRRKKK